MLATAAPPPEAAAAERYVITWQVQQPVAPRAPGRRRADAARRTRRVRWHARAKAPQAPAISPGTVQGRAASPTASVRHSAGTDPAGPHRLQSSGGGGAAAGPAGAVLRHVAWLQAAVRALPPGSEVALRTAGALSFPAASDPAGAFPSLHPYHDHLSAVRSMWSSSIYLCCPLIVVFQHIR